MVSELRNLRILLASPSDVAAEREGAQRVVAELNRTVPLALGVHLELIAWETHSTPAMGSDAQAVLNKQLGDDYNIFVGLLWSRIGTPTPRAVSGTMEEFERAYARWKDDPNSVSVMFYFKEAGVSPFDVDPDQLRTVQSFRHRLQGQAITATFNATEEFETHLRVHLTRHVFAWANPARLQERSAATRRGAPLTTASALQEDVEVEEEGLLDLVEKANEGFRAVVASVLRLTEETQQVGTFIGAHAEKIQALDISQPTDAKRGKQLLNRTAERLLAFSRRVDRELPVLHDGTAVAIGSVGKAAQLAPDFGPGSAQGLEENLSALRELNLASAKARGQLSAWRRQVESTPRITTRLNRAKRETIAALDRLDKEFAAALDLGMETERMIEEVLKQLRSI